MISLITICYDRQEMLDKTLPLWVAQEAIELEIIMAVGPNIKRIEHPKVKYIDCPDGWFTLKGIAKGGKTFNLLWPLTKGEQVFITYSDMLMPNPKHLATMLKSWKPGRMINHENFGAWTHGMLVDRKLIEKSSGWDEFFDDGYAFEDSDFVSGLLEVGGELVFLKERADGLKHIDHPRAPDTAERNKRYCRNKTRYHEKHKVTLMEMMEHGKFKLIDEE